MPVPDTRPVIYVVDDDFSVREGLDSLFRSVGYQTCCFASVDEFMAHDRAESPSCLILDVRMPGKNGLELQRELVRREDAIPIIFLTGHGDVPMSVQALKTGAVDFLLKPFREQDLLDGVRSGIDQDRARRRDDAAIADVSACVRTLSLRERQIIDRVVSGQSSRDIAGELDLKEITVKIHRASAMKKMKAMSLVDLVQKINSLKRTTKLSVH